MVNILTSVLLSAWLAFAQAPLAGEWQPLPGGHELKGLANLRIDDAPVAKRFVLRIPDTWNGSLVVGAHGGSGGDAVDRAGRKYATSETALDDVIGRYAFDRGFAYASFDRDGFGNGDQGYFLTHEFLQLAKNALRERTGRNTERSYVVGLSAGGGIARRIAETSGQAWHGALIIAGAGGDVITRLDRQQRIAALWPLIDPRAHYGLSDKDPKILSYADANGTPVASRRLWPYTGMSAVAAASRPPGDGANSSARPRIPTIEVAGTWDDIVIREVRAYAERVEPKDRHRLYQVEGVWHMSGDDDGVQGFQYNAETRMKLGKDVADAMGESPSYIPTVHEAFNHLVRWVEGNVPPPPNQTVKPKQILSPKP